ncbi:hypothetical protein BH23ACT3_BH23ACT3_16040 [soil metagenome]
MTDIPLTAPAPLQLRPGAHVVHADQSDHTRGDTSVSTTFVLWAPAATTVHLELSAPISPDQPIAADSSQRTLELSARIDPDPPIPADSSGW